MRAGLNLRLICWSLAREDFLDGKCGVSTVLGKTEPICFVFKLSLLKEPFLDITSILYTFFVYTCTRFRFLLKMGIIKYPKNHIFYNNIIILYTWAISFHIQNPHISFFFKRAFISYQTNTMNQIQ